MITIFAIIYNTIAAATNTTTTTTTTKITNTTIVIINISLAFTVWCRRRQNNPGNGRERFKRPRQTLNASQHKDGVPAVHGAIRHSPGVASKRQQR